MTPAIGNTLGHYRIESQLGAGGMGIVYKARDTHLDRDVALKLLPPYMVADSDRRQRFIKEARAASAINHPNIVHVYDIAPAAQTYFIAMELIAGQTLKSLIADKGLPVKTVLEYAVQIASAVVAAHSAGVIHRDLKPANIMVTPEGLIKVLDFGVAKFIPHDPGSDDSTLTVTPETTVGKVLGTAAYMSPEQAQGKPVDERSDFFSFGAIFYEMLTGRRAFDGDSYFSVVSAVVRDIPRDVRELRPEVPTAVADIVNRCLEKTPDKRYATAAELAAEIRAARTAVETPSSLWRRPARAAAVIVLLFSLPAGWMYVRESRVRSARAKVPELSQLIEERKLSAAFRVVRQIEPYLPGDAAIERFWRDYAFPVSIRSKPSGARVFIRPYAAGDGEWELLGITPIANIRLPLINLRIQLEKEGFRTVEVEMSEFNVRELVLHTEAEAPSGMVHVPAGESQFAGVNAVPLPEFWIDKYEVTNRDFRRFVEAGGYQDRQYWKHPFLKGRSTLSWDQAMEEFRDSTGRPGPSTWELGTYPDGRGDFPVTGVSWYEAAAYAEFAGKSLPTVFHWFLAAGRALNPHHILASSNFSGQSPAKVGEFQGLGPFGTFDMAGNAREWCSNDNGAVRYLLGGSWSEAQYLFRIADARPPFDRSPLNGFRCARYPVSPPAETLARVQPPVRDFTKEKPVTDAVFQAFARMYAYDPTPLNARVELTGDTRGGRREKITFDAAYGPERVIAYLFLPNNAKPPFQPIVYFPSLDAVTARSATLEENSIRFLVRSGRAVVYPIYKGTHERRAGIPTYGTRAERDRIIFWAKDFRRAVDYVQTRPDLDSTRIGFYGLSMGGIYGPIMTALDTRVKASVLVAAGLPSHAASCCFRPQPEVDPFHFAPRSHTPTLMVNGKDDFITPFETAQKPLFAGLGAPSKDKRHAVFEGGHRPARSQDEIRETLSWFDKYLGPVTTHAVDANVP